MEAACLRSTELPHTSKLFADFLYDFDRVAPFYGHMSETPEFPADRRAALIRALREQNGDSDSLRLLARPETVAVVTGQQVGLYSGPAYTIYKALTAVRIARRLTEQGKPAVPVFWLATEDHDFAEVNHAWVFDAQNTPVPLSVGDRRQADQPVGGIRIDRWPHETLRGVLRDHPFGEEATSVAESAYAPGAAMGEAFRSLLEALLGRYGLLYIDPLRPAVREIASPLLARAVEAAPDLTQRLLERNAQLTTAGYHAQVHVEPKTSLFFLLQGDRRIALRRQNGDYISRDRRYSMEELRAQAEHISPNALLRPVVQDYILPTAAYVGGPAELAYLAQSQVVYETLLGRAPHLFSRSAFTLFDSRSAKLMQRYRIRVQDFFHGEDALREKMARVLIPGDTAAEFDRARAATAELLDRLTASVSGFDPTLAAAVEKSSVKIMYQLSKSHAKVARETMRRDERAREDARYLYGGVFPHKHLQERFYSIIPFLARHGMNLIDRIHDQVRLDCPDHVLLTVS